MKKYNDYKNSGVEWIGEIPSHWEETRLRFIGNLFGGLTGKSGDDFKQDDNPNNKPYIPYTNIFRNTYISKEHVDYVVIQKGENQNRVEKFDLFFLMSSETYQDLGKPCILIDDVEELYLNSFCKGFRVVHKETNPLFINYQLLGDVHKELISIEGRGFTRINLRQDRLNDTPILLPPLSEQQQIVSYLDTKTSQIDSLIEKTQRKIELLKEKRTSLINEVVTKGLNPNVEMKDSDVEWIGEIPSHWETSFFRYYIKLRHGYQFRDYDFTDEGIKIIKITQLHKDGYLDISNCSTIDSTRLNEFSDIIVKEKDILMCLTGGTIGKIIRVGNVSEPLLQNYRVGHFSTKNSNYLIDDFLFYLMSSEVIIGQIFYDVRETGQPNIGLEDMNRMRICLPPLSEQNEIVSYLDEHTQLIDKTILVEEKRVELLKEYRQSLISEVVTGKRKVIFNE
jgi:type I restriction enzyme, S subunit